jgi:hypothetical protein
MMNPRIALIGLCLLAASGCRPFSLYLDDPPGTPEYKLGWEDGCDSGLAAAGSMVERMAFGFRKRPEMGESETYRSAWNEGFAYCRFATDPVDKGTWYD